IPVRSGLKSRAPMAFPEEAPHPQWRPTSLWQKPFAFAGRMAGAAVRGIAFGMAWLAFRIGRALAFLVGRPMSAAGRVAMAPCEPAERGYLRLLPGALTRPGPVLGIAALAF